MRFRFSQKCRIILWSTASIFKAEVNQIGKVVMGDGSGQSEPEGENYKHWEEAISPSEEERSGN